MLEQFLAYFGVFLPVIVDSLLLLEALRILLLLNSQPLLPLELGLVVKVALDISSALVPAWALDDSLGSTTEIRTGIEVRLTLAEHHGCAVQLRRRGAVVFKS